MEGRKKERKVTKTFFSSFSAVSQFNSVRASVSELPLKKGL